MRELLNKHFEEEVENNYHIFNNKGPERSRLLHNRLRTCIFKLHLNYVFSLTVEEFDLKKISLYMKFPEKWLLDSD